MVSDTELGDVRYESVAEGDNFVEPCDCGNTWQCLSDSWLRSVILQSASQVLYSSPEAGWLAYSPLCFRHGRYFWRTAPDLSVGTVKRSILS